MSRQTGHFLRLVWFGLVLCTRTLVAQMADNAIFVNDPLKWEAAQRSGQAAPKLASARLLILQPNGHLATISCMLYRTPEERLTILYSEGYSLSYGTWSRSDEGKINVRYRSIYSSIRPRGGSSSVVKEESWEFVPSRARGQFARLIRVGSARFVPLVSLEEPAELVKLIEFHRKEDQERN